MTTQEVAEGEKFLKFMNTAVFCISCSLEEKGEKKCEELGENGKDLYGGLST